MKFFLKLIVLFILGPLSFYSAFSSKISSNLDEQASSFQKRSINLRELPDPFWKKFYELSPQTIFSLRINQSFNNEIERLSPSQKLRTDFKQAQLAYERIKAFKKSASESQFSQLITSDFVNDLNSLSHLAEQGFLKAMHRYCNSLENMRKGSLDEAQYRKILAHKDNYKNKLVSYYEKYLDKDLDENFLNQTKYRYAKLMFMSDLAGDPGLIRKKKGLPLLRELESKGFEKAKHLHSKVLKK